MSKEMNSVKQAIKTYLDERAKTDELFAASYAKPNKSIDECFNYILGEAKKQGNAVYLSDEVVFGWAVHYYDEDDIKINKIPANTKVSTTANIELSEEDKEKARKHAIKSFEKQCIAEMKAAEEGKAMHHCVHSMGYYKRPNSLILSAKDKKGKRIETIEVDLKTFKIVQSRGVNNSNTPKHDEIIRLVNNNMKLIREVV